MGLMTTPFEIGIASSVAKAENYSWPQTIRYANLWNVKLIQLYLSNGFEKQLADLENQFDLSNYRIYWHLSDDFLSNSLSNLKYITRYSCNFIIHENTLRTIGALPEKLQTINLYIENDNKYPNSCLGYLSFISEKFTQADYFYSAFDIPRFFEQNHLNFPFDEIEKISLNILDYLVQSGREFMLHLIDLGNLDAQRSDWKTLFSGILPIKVLLKRVLNLNRSIPVILEYESPEQCFNSIQALTNFMGEFSQ